MLPPPTPADRARRGTRPPRPDDERLNLRSSIPFFLCHLIPLLGFVTGFHVRDFVLLAVLYWVRLFFITAGYHRYFAHRSYRLGRAAQFVMAFGGTMAAQKGPLWWAANHRTHHQHADTRDDVHSPIRGFWWSHVGWILCDRSGATDLDRIRDFAKYPELRFLNKHDWIGPWALGVVSYLIAGWSGVVVGFFGSTVLLWHATFLVNSLAHVFGRRRYLTPDTSRNSLLIAVLTGGEGWHNNHHYYQASARQGFYWWEIDPVFAMLRVLSFVGIVSELRTPPRAVRDARPEPSPFDAGLVRARLERARDMLECERQRECDRELREHLRNALAATDDVLRTTRMRR
ncbi:MAG: Delta-9 acyl-phospholipid desaturase [Actinomycetia bacterium]|nr:Delta-9 acyl-phospholipid desaturase [Actinomycetes bacterium]